ncbi:MAG: exo-alpha-sialidase [Chloroflexi bacterium]|nr:MAG: exo-alpha-sialidase [Chloroflexota bacterium]
MAHCRPITRALIGLATLAATAFSPSYASAAGLAYTAAAPVQVSNCSGQNAEVEQATDPKPTLEAPSGYIYEEWMAAGCQGIAFSRSTDAGKTWSSPSRVPGATGSTFNSWDPDVVVGPDGTVYAAYMTSNGSQWYPVVAVSSDHGQTFPRVTVLNPPDPKNWGDRDFLAVGPDNTVYLTYDYGPNRTSVTFVCASSGSCGFSTGDVNVVMQKSSDHGQTWSGMYYVSPGFPNSGSDSGPIFVEPSGRIDVLLQEYPLSNVPTDNMGPGVEEFTSSPDGGATWSKPVVVGPNNGTMSVDEWWIDGALAVDSAGNLYASWDTQQGFRFGLGTPDTGWLSFSTNGGNHWSKPVQVTDNAPVPHIMEVTPGPTGTVYVSWLTQVTDSVTGSPGYAEFLRPFSITAGWLTKPIQVSGTNYGDPNTWPGDTTGLSTYNSLNQVVLSWGSAVNSHKSAIYSSVVTFS